MHQGCKECQGMLGTIWGLVLPIETNCKVSHGVEINLGTSLVVSAIVRYHSVAMPQTENKKVCKIHHFTEKW